MSAEQKIRDAMRVREIMKDEVFVAALAGLKWRNYDEFENAASSEDRIRAQAKAVVLRDFLDAFQVVLDSGELEVLKIAEQAKKDARRAPHSKE
jgi:aryl-alcohol dehydrogenase-like predicted oxidoreductase